MAALLDQEESDESELPAAEQAPEEKAEPSLDFTN